MLHKNGDLVIWGNAPYGHIAIANGDADDNIFYSYDQNWNGKYIHLVQHNYNNVYGSLRPYAQDKVLGLSLSLEEIVDLDLYNECYEDLRIAFGNKNWSRLYQHIQEYGISEGRLFSYVYDPKFYLSKYEDLRKAFGNDYNRVLDHYLNNGCREGRFANKVFDVMYYKTHNEDLRNMNNKEATLHFLTYGIKEWRNTSPEFNVKVYRDSNKDLKKAFGNDCKLYYRHYLAFGRNENRKIV